MGRFGTLVVTTPTSGEVRYALDSPKVTLGRGVENDVVLLDIKVSRRHAALLCTPEGLKLQDLGSSNGFKLNGQRVREATLTATDQVTLGASDLRVLFPTSAPADEETQVGAAEQGFEASITDNTVPRLVITRQGRSDEFKIASGRALIGRSNDVDVVIDHPKVSRHHAEVLVSVDKATLRDLGSRNGTTMHGQPVQTASLANGDTFEVGDARVVFKSGFTADQLSVVQLSPLKTQQMSASAVARSAAQALAEDPDTNPGQARSKTDRSAAHHTQTAEAHSDELPPQLRVPGKGPRLQRPAGRLPVVVVPGFMGSTLYRGDTMIWPAAKTFLKNPEMLKLPEEKDLEPRGLVEEVVVIPGLIKLDAYNRLVEYLCQALGYVEGKDLFVCAYDWRMDLRHAARSLGSFISRWEESADKVPGKFIIIGHSAGGLVARYYVERMGGRHHVERLILLGAPNKGTPKPLMTMLGGGTTLPFGSNKQKLKETVATFLSAYQLLPAYPVVYDGKGPVDLLRDDSWVPEKARLAIKDAREFQEELGQSSRVPVVSIFGYGQKTLARIDVKRAPDGTFTDAKFTEEDCGDGTVSQESAILPGSEIHPVQQHHGALYTDNDVKMRLKLELLGTF